MAIWIDALPSGIGTFQLGLRFKDQKENILISAKIAGNTGALVRTGLPIGPFPIQIKEDGPIIFEWSFLDPEWVKVGDIVVRKGVIV